MCRAVIQQVFKLQLVAVARIVFWCSVFTSSIFSIVVIKAVARCVVVTVAKSVVALWATFVSF